MELWKTLLGASIAILVGIIIGVVYSYIHFRVIEKTRVNFKTFFSVIFRQSKDIKPQKVRLNKPIAVTDNKPQRSAIKITNQQPLSKPQPRVASTAISSTVVVNAPPITPMAVKNIPVEIPVVRPPINNPLAVFVDELEYNLKTIKEFRGNKLLPLKTDSWEKNRRLLKDLPPDFQNNLDSIYTDIGMLNQLVWISSEFNRSSQNMLNQYMKLVSSISVKINECLEMVSDHVH
jgi:hypothetical protein